MAINPAAPNPMPTGAESMGSNAQRSNAGQGQSMSTQQEGGQQPSTSATDAGQRVTANQGGSEAEATRSQSDENSSGLDMYV